MGQRKTIPASLRQAQVCQLLADRPSVTIAELASRYRVSEMTVRRDLDRLEKQGRLRRTHGGAMPGERMVFEFDFAQRRQSRRPAKQAIAREAFKLIRPGHRLILDTGTTTLELAALLVNCSNLTVITPSLAVGSQLQFAVGVQTILLGGQINRGSPDLTGGLTESNLDQFAADIAFQGADGIGADGAMYTNDLRIVRIDTRIRQRAKRTFVLVDSGKIGKVALARNGHVREVDALITDSDIAPADLKALRKLGATVLIARG
jgi:DeoR/GlpR family transcriptional regulator of sugar metabolism